MRRLRTVPLFTPALSVRRYPRRGGPTTGCDGTIRCHGPKGTRLLGVVALILGFGGLAWVWTSELPAWWKALMSAIAAPFVAVGLQYVLSGRYPVLVLDDEGITY